MFSLILIQIITALTLALSHGNPKIYSEIAKGRADNLNYKLTENVFPENYTLRIFPHINNSTFNGYVKILVHVKIPTYNITLHQKNLNITKEKIYLKTIDNVVIEVENAGMSGTEEQEFYTITFAKMLNEKTYYLFIPEFYGVLNEVDHGFYLANYTDENGKLRKFATTLFEFTYARNAFPCFDEPSFRAKFKIYIVRPSHYSSFSNAKLIKSIMVNSSLYEDEFELTVSMPTYLLAFVVSEMKLSSSPDNNFYRILARPEAVNKGYEKYSLKLSSKIMQTLETYLSVNYSLDKMDQVAIPDDFFTFGAQEAWGLVLYKESYLLVTPRTTTLELMNIDITIAHEFVHQWFGNLVTIKWWRYLWLKEGFAKFLESRIVDKVKPEWRMMEQFVIKQQRVFEIDSSNKMREMNQDAGTRNEIRNLYDEITYDKAACVVHMLETIMTPKIFERGLTNFLQDREFQSAISTDLYRNLQKSLDDSGRKFPQKLNIRKIMTTWVSQKGYPLVYVERHYDINLTVVKLAQSRYVNIEDFQSKPTTWYIPINYASKSNPNFNDTRCSDWLLKPNETIVIGSLKPDDWLIFNKQEAYYYRVNYDVKNWKLIAKALEENYMSVHILNRAQIIDDSFNLAKMKKLDISIPLEICSYLHQEDDYITHNAFLRNIIDIAKVLRGSDVEPYFQDYVIQTLKRSYKRLGTNHRAADTDIDKLHRVQVVGWMCQFNYSQCRANTWKTFDQWRKNNKSLAVDLELEIMCNAIRYGNKDDWNYLFRKSEDDEYREIRMVAIESLMCTENVSILQHMLDTSLNSSEFPVYLVTYLISEKGLVGSQMSMQYVAENFNLLCSKFADSIILYLLSTITSYLTTEAQLEKFEKLLNMNRTLHSKFLPFFEQARTDVSQTQKRVQQISKFFYDHHPKIKSVGNLCRAIPNIFAFLFYSFIVMVVYII